ncbi:tetratricopeptide repeat protein [Sphingomonas sp. MA1305]|uniref:tetratricopeptide repeat protein n=1 Tax=Sphingomonas sp. MA1305 TaxID=2479204 RepID=UPI0018E04A3A|nr:tetratricopeptide repeat protein [Sphingomonas sp. MA1305]MBI0474490.1 tetratricopeptide repeat protein [Sphingomonas sp. MA1305]
MIGWLCFAALALAVSGAMILIGLPRLLWSSVGAAIMLAGVGYAMQGRPSLPAHPATPRALIQPDDLTMFDLRDRMLGRYSADAAYLTAADAMTRAGEPQAAVRVILGGIEHVPESLMLWTALGSAMAAHDGGQLSPPALFAFQQAMRLSPQHPAPPFFLGLAYLREENFEEARRYWARALALTPAHASYRRDVEVRLALLDRLIAMREGDGVTSPQR